MQETGGCACGRIRYTFDAEPLFMGFCHCRDCQRASGGGSSAVMVIAAASLRITQGQPRTFSCTSDAGSRAHRRFCGDCGTPLFAHSDGAPAFVGLRPASLDDPACFQPAGHVWTRSAQPWDRLDPALPHWPGMPGD